jgi:hypothetical protein
MNETHGIHKLIDEIQQATDLGLYYVAMIGLLTLPDQMAALGHPSGETTGSRYRSWYAEHVESPLSAEDAWRLRCSLLHQARSTTAETRSSDVRRVAFAEPSSPSTVKTGYMAGTVMLIHVPDLCDVIIPAARSWLAAKEYDETVRANLDKTLLRGTATHISDGRQVNSGITMVMSIS